MTDPNGGAAWRQTIFYPFMASKYGRGSVLLPSMHVTEHETSGHGTVTDADAVAVYDDEKEEITIFAVNRTQSLRCRAYLRCTEL